MDSKFYFLIILPIISWNHCTSLRLTSLIFRLVCSALVLSGSHVLHMLDERLRQKSLHCKDDSQTWLFTLITMSAWGFLCPSQCSKPRTWNKWRLALQIERIGHRKPVSSLTLLAKQFKVSRWISRSFDILPKVCNTDIMKLLGSYNDTSSYDCVWSVLRMMIATYK